MKRQRAQTTARRKHDKIYARTTARQVSDNKTIDSRGRFIGGRRFRLTIIVHLSITSGANATTVGRSPLAQHFHIPAAIRGPPRARSRNPRERDLRGGKRDGRRRAGGNYLGNYYNGR